MASKTVLDPSKTDQAGTIFNSVAELANAIRKMGIELIDGGAADFDVNKALIVRELAQQIGWLSDLGAEKVDGSVCFGGAEDWMLPPSFHPVSKRST